MARMARVVVPNCWHHVTQRGNRGQTVFFEDSDRMMYLQLLARHTRRHGVRVAGYCLMGNHVHLIASPLEEDALAKCLGRTHVDYARWLNVRRGETGHVWQNRFFSCPMDDRYTWEALRYVELNPVRASLVRDAIEWPWSSATSHAAGADHSGFLDLAEWHERWSPAAWLEALSMGIADAALLARIREATGTGRPAASEEFIRELESVRGERLRPRKRGPSSKAVDDGRQSKLLGVS